MRPLKRPMFRTGGPIKEGLMNGLKDGGPATYMADATMMAGGGMPNMRGRVTGPGGYAGKPVKENFLKRNYGKLATGAAGIYNAPEILELLRFFYKDGGVAGLPPMRGMVTGPGKYSQQLEFDFAKDIERRIKKNPAKAVKPGTYAVPAVKAGVRKYLPSLEGIGGKTMGGIKNLFRKTGVKIPPRKIPLGGKPLSFFDRVNLFARLNPKTTIGGAYFSPEIYGVGKGLVENVLFPVGKTLLDPSGKRRETFGKVKKALGFDDEKIPPPVTTKPGASNVPDAVSGTTKKTQAEIDAEKAATDQKKLDRIYKLLGVDRAKRDAASKALIDMSRYIDEGGRDVISKKNIGSTISKAIGAFDKRLDKVDQLKEAAGLMRAKGIIEKDIRESDNKLKELSIELKNKELNPKFSELKIAAAKTMPGQKGYDSAASASDPDNFRGNIITQSEFSKIIDDIKEKSGELDETIIIKNWTEEKIKGKNLTDGNYTVGSSLVTIKDNKVVNVAR
jgi:hypothetical protein